MIVRTVRGNREFRTTEFGSSVIPPPGFGYSAFSGIPVTADRTFGLPAVIAAVRLIATLTATMDLGVYRGTGGDKETAEDSWQDKLLDQPNSEQSQFDFISDVAAGPEGYGNAFVEKVKFRGEVVELIPRDPDYVRVRRDGGRKVFDVSVDGRTRRNLTPAQILHVRGFTTSGYLSGFSPITLHRNALGTALALEEFQGRYFANNAEPGGAIVMPGSTTKTRALEILDLWSASHGGVSNAGKPGILSGGATWQTIGISLVDAQFVEAQKFTVEQIARIFGVPQDLIGGALDRGVAATAEQVGLRFLSFFLMPRLKRIEMAFAADLDLFAQTDVYPKFVTDDLLRADALTKAQVQHMQIQSGVLLADEARAEMGLPPLPDGVGQIPLVTPVGAGPNPAPLPSSNGSTA
jgi:HK97 family phage portal protein